MSDIRKHAVEATSRLHLRDAHDAPLYADDPSGNADKTKPMVAVIYGHGSKQHAKWANIANNRFVQRLKRKGGKADQTEQEQAEERVEMLLIYTQSFENFAYGELLGEAAVRAVYEDPTLGYIADQVAAHIADWGNFVKPSTTN